MTPMEVVAPVPGNITPVTSNKEPEKVAYKRAPYKKPVAKKSTQKKKI